MGNTSRQEKVAIAIAITTTQPIRLRLINIIKNVVHFFYSNSRLYNSRYYEFCINYNNDLQLEQFLEFQSNW